MIRYYSLLFFRNLKRQKLFSLINLVGLTAGVVSTLFMYLYVRNEFSYDRFHEKYPQIFRINQTFIWGVIEDKQFASLGPGVAYAIKEEIPEVQEVTRIYQPGDFVITTTEETDLVQKNILGVDSSFLRIFSFPLLKGDAKTALRHPNSILLTASMEKRYFGKESGLGKILELEQMEQRKAYVVTGILADVPTNSYITFDMLISMNSFDRMMDRNNFWLFTVFETFVLLDPKASLPEFKQKLNALPPKYAGSTIEGAWNQTYDDYVKSGKKWELFAQPLSEIRLHSTNIYNRLNDVGNVKIVYSLIMVAVLIVMLCCINFMNLSTAQYSRRVKESGLRKILGSNHTQLALHFFLETCMFCGLAIIVGVGITQLLLPSFNHLVERNLSLDILQNPEIIAVLLVLIVMMSLLSGSYPALYLTAFSPVRCTSW